MDTDTPVATEAPEVAGEITTLRTQLTKQKRRARWLMIALTIGGIIVGASAGGTEVPQDTTQLTACREALDLAHEGFNLAAEGFGIVSAQFDAVSRFDASGVEAGTAKMDAISSQVTALQDPLREKSAECRS